jgi:ATP-binding cassette subfamily F protein 3
MNEKSKVLTPLREKIEVLEEKICKLEEELETITAELQKANENQDGGAIATLSKRLHDVQKHIEASFNELEKTVRIHNEKNSHFEELLNK